MNVKDVLQTLEQAAPRSLAESWDNVGFLVGRATQAITGILCALDVTEEVLQEAVQQKAQLIVAHHPVIFQAVSSITDETPTGRILRSLIRADISVICMHTNLDSAESGVNDQLAKALGLTAIANMGAGESGQLGRIGTLEEPMLLPDFVRFTKEKLQAGGIRFVDGGRQVKTVAVGGGSCGKLMDFALEKGADTFVIGDSSYDVMLSARDKGLNLIDAGHFPTENTVVPELVRLLQEAHPEACVMASQTHRDCILFG